MNDYFSVARLTKIGFKRVGKNCKISKYTRVYNGNICVGNNVRIDDDVILKGNINIGSNVHLGRGCTLSGGRKGIYIGDFSAFSNYVQIFSVSDDYLADAIPAATLNKKELLKKLNILSIDIIGNNSSDVVIKINSYFAFCIPALIANFTPFLFLL